MLSALHYTTLTAAVICKLILMNTAWTAVKDATAGEKKDTNTSAQHRQPFPTHGLLHAVSLGAEMRLLMSFGFSGDNPVESHVCLPLSVCSSLPALVILVDLGQEVKAVEGRGLRHAVK